MFFPSEGDFKGAAECMREALQMAFERITTAPQQKHVADAVKLSQDDLEI